MSSNRFGFDSVLTRVLRIVAVGLCALFVFGCSVATAADDAATVAALDVEYQAAVENNDAGTMARILADDFVLVTGTGKTFTRADLLAEARS